MLRGAPSDPVDSDPQCVARCWHPAPAVAYTSTAMRRIWVALLLVAAAFGASGGVGAQPPRATNARAVVVVSLDGFPARALADPNVPAPNLRALIASGASAAAMTTVNPAVTWPAHTTFVTGVAPAAHGVVFNGMLIR